MIGTSLGTVNIAVKKKIFFPHKVYILWEKDTIK